MSFFYSEFSSTSDFLIAKRLKIVKSCTYLESADKFATPIFDRVPVVDQKTSDNFGLTSADQRKIFLPDFSTFVSVSSVGLVYLLISCFARSGWKSAKV